MANANNNKKNVSKAGKYLRFYKSGEYLRFSDNLEDELLASFDLSQKIDSKTEELNLALDSRMTVVKEEQVEKEEMS